MKKVSVIPFVDRCKSGHPDCYGCQKDVIYWHVGREFSVLTLANEDTKEHKDKLRISDLIDVCKQTCSEITRPVDLKLYMVVSVVEVKVHELIPKGSQSGNYQGSTDKVKEYIH